MGCCVTLPDDIPLPIACHATKSSTHLAISAEKKPDISPTRRGAPKLVWK